jgi:hypothetical protein
MFAKANAAAPVRRTVLSISFLRSLFRNAQFLCQAAQRCPVTFVSRVNPGFIILPWVALILRQATDHSQLAFHQRRFAAAHPPI